MSDALKQLIWVGGIIIFLFLSFVGMYVVFENTFKPKETIRTDLPIRYSTQHGNSSVQEDIDGNGD